MTVVLGLNGTHGVGVDAGAALVVDDTVVAAVEEERLLRVKKAPGARPRLAAREVVELGGVSAQDIDVIAYGWMPEAIPVPRDDVMADLRRTCELAGLSLRPDVEICFVEHHVAHAWSGMAFLPDELRGRRIAALALDGAGESTSGSMFRLKGDEFDRSWYLTLASSLGIYYEGITSYLGFAAGQEGKTMGLAAYGHPIGLPLPELTDDRVDGDLPTRPDAHRDLYPYLVRSLAGRLEQALGTSLSFVGRADLARTVQERITARVLDYVNEILDEVDVLVYAGGLALNCSLNGRLARVCRAAGVDLVIPPPAGDAGIALGAAVAMSPRPAACMVATDFGLGRAVDPETVTAELSGAGLTVERIDADELSRRLVEENAVAGWYDGPAEIGPRALGRRCIVARPDSEALRDVINVRKSRETWRPLAPSVTPAEFARSFTGVPSPHMLVAAQVEPAARERLAGVTHVDNTARPQVVTSDDGYARLLAAMGRRTGTEAVVCTSFNQAGEPIVYRPAEALRSARAMGLDLLAGDGWCVRLGR